MSVSAPIWANLTPDEHEFQYNPQRAFPDFDKVRARRQPDNDAALRDLKRHADLAYGDHPLRKLDVYPVERTGGETPVHVFVHGGYWRAQDKQNFAFVAGCLVPLGITTVIINYELCPGSTLDGVAESAIAAFDWIRGNIGKFGGDAQRITLSGHSAGAHLGAEIMAHPWPEAASTALQGAILTSGIYDPTPAMQTTVNAQLNLTEEIVERRNVEARVPVLMPRTAIFAGGREPWQWVDQSFRYYHALRQRGFEPALHILPDRDHFDILDEYLDAGSLTVRTIVEHCAPDRKEGAA